ncbi:MAG TPA: RNA 2',3'-cyclic phosphodiesterase [Candidatus Acidoferrum sp.]
MRLFVALAISAEVRESLASVIRALRVVDAKPKWIPLENLHVTLKFIGEVPTEKLAAIDDALTGVRIAEQVKLEFCNIGFFPNDRLPSVAWAGIQATPDLAALAATINTVLVPLGLPHEEKTFVPHLTIARFKKTRLSSALLAEIEKWKNHSFGRLSVGEFHLIESKLKATGAEYTTLRSFSFVRESPESKES